MRSVLGLLLLVALPQFAIAKDSPGKWQVKHTITLEQPATALAVGKTWAATGQPDGTIRVWALDTGKELAKLVPPGKPGAIRTLTGPADGTVLYGIEGDKSGFRWDWSQPNATRYARRAFEGRLLDVTADGKQWAVCDEKGIKILAADLTAADFKPKVAVELELWTQYRDILVAQMKADPSRIHGLIPPDGTGLAVWVEPVRLAGNAAARNQQNAPEERLRNSLIRWDDRGEICYASLWAPRTAVFSVDGKLLVSVGNVREAYMLESTKPGHYSCVTQVLEDGFRRGRIVDEILPFPPFKPDAEMKELAAVFHPVSEALLTAGSDGKIRFWNLRAFRREDPLVKLGRQQAGVADKPADVLAGHTGPVRALGFAPNGLTLVTSGDDKKVLVWVPKR